MKKIDFKNKNKVELIKEIEERKLSLRGIRFSLSGSKAKNVKSQKTLKKEIARANTAISAL